MDAKVRQLCAFHASGGMADAAALRNVMHREAEFDANLANDRWWDAVSAFTTRYTERRRLVDVV